MLARDLKTPSDENWGMLDQLQQKAGGMTWHLYKSLTAPKAAAATPQ
jgi:hypothetical protein